MRGAPGRSDRHPSHTFVDHYCTTCGTFIGSLHASIGEPCAMDRRVEDLKEEFDWLKSLRSEG